MNYKIRKKPLKLAGYESLLNRLPPDHPSYQTISEEWRRQAAGFSGEKNFDYHANEFRPDYPYAFLHDLCLRHNGIYFQMDSVLITPACIIIFEIKNLTGRLLITSDPTQFIQEKNGVPKVIQNPIIEIERKEIFLSKWLEARGLNIPIKGIIGLAYQNELSIPDKADRTIVTTQEIPVLLYKSELSTPSLLAAGQIKKLAQTMVANHSEYNPFPLTEHLKIDKNTILTGVLCEHCDQFGMIWFTGTWVCSHCNSRRKDAHLSAINDYFMLIDKKITNVELRRFLHVSDSQVAKRLLKKSRLHMTGRTKNSYYVQVPASNQ